MFNAAVGVFILFLKFDVILDEMVGKEGFII